ncbi:MAG: hypothetical protein JWM82_4079, partial [Myxococcales bacterium]|nr:hypothetical protein [Myxococcales bacterium]
LARDAEVEELGARPPTRALACTDVGEPRVVAVGVGLWSSHDGRAWLEDGTDAGAAYTDVALTNAGAWLATENGLRGPTPPEAGDVGPIDGVPRVGPPRQARELPRWSAFLPRLTVAFATWSESQGRAGWHCWALLTFSIDRRARARMNALSEAPP